MRYNNYLTEETDIKDTIQLIDNKCQPFIKELRKSKSNNIFLYSGRDGKPNTFIGEVRQDRKPRNTNKDIHEIADKVFFQLFGIKARSNTLFVTPIINDASFYGTPYIIFPIGEFKIIWSLRISDFTMAIDDRSVWEPQGFKEIIKHIGGLSLDYREMRLRKWIKDNYKIGDIPGALNSRNEIMVHCKQYLAVKHDNHISETLKNYIQQ